VERKEPGVNVLLYGPPGTGKTELAKVCAAAAGLELYEVEYADRDGNSLGGRDRYRSLQISQVFLKGSEAGCRYLAEESRIPVVKATNLIEATQDTGAFVQLSGVYLIELSIRLERICRIFPSSATT
jgi:DNA polymerase III delta prime subunit